mmetsp:Transcript_78867/g.180426  ORF Transcript_78867/g.180426 Transcript_78867/m.180426 type:complete len:289 (+) Transcript_78867:272-1138(+)
MPGIHQHPLRSTRWLVVHVIRRSKHSRVSVFHGDVGLRRQLGCRTVPRRRHATGSQENIGVLTLWQRQRRGEGSLSVRLRPLVHVRQPLVVRPIRDVDRVEAVVRQAEKLEHGQHEISDICQEIGIVLHVLGSDQQLPTAAQFEQDLAMSMGNYQIPLTMHNQSRTADLVDPPLVVESLCEESRHKANGLPEYLPNGRKRRHQDEPRNFILLSDGQGRPRPNGATKNLDAVQGPFQHVSDKIKASKGIVKEGGLTAAAGAHAVPGKLHDKYMHLKLVPQHRAELIAPA